MDLKRLQQLLADHTQNGVLTLPPGALESDDIQALLERYYRGQDLVLRIDEQGLQGEVIRMLGALPEGTFPLLVSQGSPVPATADFYLVEGKAQVLLDTRLPTGYRFGDSFPEVAPTLVNLLALSAASLRLRSLGPGSDGLAPEIPKGLSFSSGAAKTGPLAPVAFLLGSGAELLLSGPITFQDMKAGGTAALLDLSAPTSGGAIVGPFGVDVTLRVRTRLDEDSKSPLSVVPFTGHVQLATVLEADPLSIPLVMPLTPTAVALYAFELEGGPVELPAGLSELAGLVGGVDLAALIPPGFSLGDAFWLTQLTLGVSANAGSTPTNLGAFSIGVQLETSWTVIPGAISVEGVGLDYQLLQPLRPTLANMTLDVTGLFNLGGVGLQVTLALPDLNFGATLDENTPIEANKVLQHFLGQDVSLPEGVDLNVYVLDVQANPRSQEYAVSAVVGQNEIWSVDLGVTTLKLESITLQVEYAPNGLSGRVVGALMLFGKGFEVAVAKLPPPAGWEFSARLQAGESLSLTELISTFLPDSVKLPDDVPDLAVGNIALTYATVPPTFSLEGGTAEPWVLELGGNTYAFSAFARFQRSKPSTGPTYAASLSGSLQLNNLLLGVSYDFTPTNKTLTFRMAYRNATLTGVLTRGVSVDTVLKVNVGNVSFGEILEFLINLAAPGTDFTLPAPWNVLNRISLNGLSLVINFTKREVGVQYPIKLDLGFMRIEMLTLTYLTRNGQGTVDLGFVGSFGDQAYPPGQPLRWDTLNQPPPVVPGQGGSFFDLYYLGMGQRVALTSTRDIKNVQQAILALQNTVLPVKDTSLNPVAQMPGLRFSADSNWLFGAQFQLMNMLTLSVIFNDPDLYGLRIGLDGEKAGTFAGLAFEILYRKVTEDIGVYHLELKLPDAMRQLEFGSVSVTLPVVVIDIYTNGNFRLDFGFPVRRDFSRSFAVQVFPFVGYGGFYFALLDGNTSERVPRITNGNFKPVIEFGLGLSIGLGKTIDKGPLKAGLTLTVEAIVEGVLAWFNPDDRARPDARYFFIQGTAAIVGRLYGEVDFAIVSASVNVMAYASATLTIQSHEPIAIKLTVGVSVSASIKILFVRISFSFRMKLDLSFSIGSRTTPPWRVASGKTQPAALLGALPRHAPEPAAFRATHALNHLALLRTQAAPDWTPVNVFDGATHQLLSWLLPSLTVAGTKPEDTQVQVVLSLFAPNNIREGAHLGRAMLEAASPDGQTPFNLLLEALLAWGLHAVLGRLDGDVTAAQLQDLLTELGRPETANTAFGYENLSGFLGLNFVFWLSAQDAQGGTGERNATALPLMPALSFSTSTGVTRDLGLFNPVGEAYVQRLHEYLRQTQVDVESDVAPDPLAGTDALGRKALKSFRASGVGGTESYATVIFRDAFQLLAKSAVQCAQSLLERYPYDFQGTNTLGGVATRYGLTPGEVARANPDVGVNPSADVSLSGLTWQARDGQTLQGIADQFDLGGTAVLVEQADNLISTSLLRTGATLAVFNQEQDGSRSIAYTSQQGDSLAFIAAFFLLRNTPEPGALLQYLDWYQQTLAGLNTGVDFAPPLPAGTSLVVPVGHVTDQGIAPKEETLKYVSRKADTVVTIAAAFDAVQVEPGVLTAFEKQLQDLNPGVDWPNLQPGTALRIPALERTVQATDSFERLGNLFGLTPAQVGSANTSDTRVLAPLGLWHLPTVTLDLEGGPSLQELAARVDLTLETLADRLAGVPGLFPSGTRLTLADLPSFGVKALLEQVRTSGESNNAAAQVSRFLLHGLRPLSPDAESLFRLSLQAIREGDAADSDTQALYALTGQQFAAPAAPTDGLDVTLTNSGGASWLRFATLYTTVDGDTLAGLASRYGVAEAVLVELNPDVVWSPLATGTVLNVPGDSKLVVSLTAQQLQDNAPSKTFSPQLEENPTALPVRQDVPVQYALTTGLVWQAASPPPFAGTAPEQQAGQPGLWYFPDNLLAHAQATEGGTAVPYQLMVGVEQTGAPMKPREVSGYDWACAVEVSLRRIPSDTGEGFLPNSYLMLGTDEGGRELLLSAWQFLDPAKQPDGADLFLLYAPSPGSPQGLASDAVDGGLTSMLKTNLSTVTHSGPQARAPLAATAVPENGDYFANLLAARDFIRLVWEISAVGTGGFYLNYYTAEGTGLPDNLFTEGNLATLLFVVVPRAQSRSASPDRKLYPFNNCALLDENIDLSRMMLFAQAADQSETAASATMPAGAVGFKAKRRNPEQETPSPEQRTRSLYSLLSFNATENAFFRKGNQGLPPGPVEEDPEQTAGLPVPSFANTDPAFWQFQQVLPAWRLGLTNPVPEAPALPARKDNPYAGIRYDAATQTLSKLELTFDFQDVYGNRVPPDVAIPDLPLTVGYTDRIVGLSSWPGVTATYLFTKGTGSNPTLEVSAELDLLKYVTFPGSGLVNAVLSASTHATRFKQAYYQVFSDDVGFRLRTSVDQGSLPVGSAGYPVDRTHLRHFIGAGYVFLSTAMWQQAYEHATAQGEDLADLLERFATDAAALGDLNAQSQASALFQGAVVIPHFQVVPASFTLKQLADASGLDATRLAELNADAPLQAGTDVSTKARTHTVERDDATLAQLATTLEANAGRIATANAPDTTILAADKPFTFQGTTLLTVQGESLDALVLRFQALNLEPTVAQLAVANQDLPGMFLKDAVLKVDDHVVQAGETLAKLAAKDGFGTVAELAALNTLAPPDLFVTGTPLRLEGSSVAPGAADTLAALAALNGITLAQLVEANAQTSLREGAGVLIPDQVIWNPAREATLFVPFQAPEGVSLDVVAGRFGVTALAFAEPNRALAVFAADKSITVGGQTVKTSAGDSMDDVLAAFKAVGVDATLEQLVSAISATEGMFVPDALFTGPLARGSDASLDTLASDYNVDRDALVQVNRALRGFVRTGATVHIADAKGTEHSLTVTADDTFNTLVVRFLRDFGVETTVPALAEANKDTAKLVSADARFLLPPRPARFSAENVTPDYPSTLFAVTVVLEESREAARVDPAFAGVPGVAVDSSPIAPRTLPNVDEDLALTAFASAFEDAFPPTLKVATGNRPAAALEGTPRPTTVWAVRFDAAGISRFTVEREKPEFYALAPLSTELVSRPRVSIQKYESGKGLVNQYEEQDFQAVDLDAWMQQFLSASDVFLSAPFAVPAWFLEPGHDSFEKAVKAKGDVATLLAGHVGAVVEGTGGSQAQAAEALRQQVLVRLSSAYEVSSIIQYPVDVGSPYTDAATAPRLSGKPTLDLHLTTTTETLVTLAAEYEVSRLAVTQMLAEAPDLLNTGTTVNFGGQSHVLLPGDTLSSLAVTFGTTLEGLAYGLSVPEGDALFKPGATLNLVSAARVVVAGETFDGLAGFFNATVERVADNNRDLPDLLATDAVVHFEGESVTVKAGQTLADVAAEFSSKPTPAQLAASTGVRGDPKLLNAGRVARLLSALPDATLSTAKVALTDGGAFANFLLTVKSPADTRRLFLDLDYVLNELEHEVGQQGGIEGYQSSSWLTFVLPLGEEGREPAGVDTQIGQVVVPIPLRAYPTPPSLKGQAATVSFPEASKLEETTRWDYTFDFESQTSDQDELRVEVIFNEAPTQGAQPKAFTEDLFQALAQFISVYPQVKEDLARLLTLTPGEEDPKALGAVQAMAELMAGVGGGAALSAKESLDTPELLRFVYRVRDTRTGSIPPELDTLTLEALEVPEGYEGTWPELSVAVDGVAFVKLELTASDAQEAVYRYPAGILAGRPLTLRFGYVKRSLGTVENGTAGVSLRRNDDLLVDRATQSDFIYQTPEARFSNRAVPLNAFTSAFNINLASDLEKSLDALYALLLEGGGEGRTVKTACYYGYQLAEPTVGTSTALRAQSNTRAGRLLAETDTWLVSLLPVFLRPNAPFTSTYVKELVEAIAEWRKNNPASEQGGMFVFEVSVFSALDPEAQQPLLQLTRLVYLGLE
ncbi:LysM peptidoglycan-binding domain-containing protein [Corallococcus sp. AB032C]|uniref:LysM peptidoglycan-binding domain-containing protein n=1 Tax=Corallococcus TaxID=83461 RepID=UPI000EE2A517|nr:MULTISPECIES: LysM peptidoglycan-binding domain-containing protein [Corallococcus]NPC49621.1 LysM peptidoglycan-binding domain-containing protein [Corallococcus exiguus]RKH75799.1 LysM peptidoglycan-binding domain-containing protein [Corallococcus sp. AB032C]